jgi:hypothetical protein
MGGKMGGILPDRSTLLSFFPTSFPKAKNGRKSMFLLVIYLLSLLPSLSCVVLKIPSKPPFFLL